MLSSLILLFLLLTTVVFVLVSEDPIAIGLSMASYSTAGALLTGVEYSSYYGYLLFFVYVGALIVIFCMVVATAPNPRFTYDNPMIGILLLWALDTLSLLLSDGTNIAGSTEPTPSLVASEVSGSLFASLGQFTGSEWGYAIIALGMVLLLTVVSVVGMSNRLLGPMVIFNNN